MKHVFVGERFGLDGVEDLILFNADDYTKQQAKNEFNFNTRNDVFGEHIHQFYTFDKTDYHSVRYEGLMSDKEILNKYKIKTMKVTDFILKEHKGFSDGIYLKDEQISKLKEMTIGQRVKTYRQIRNLSAKELGEAIGKDRATIYRYESSSINIPHEVLLKIVNYLNVPINEFQRSFEEVIKQ